MTSASVPASEAPTRVFGYRLEAAGFLAGAFFAAGFFAAAVSYTHLTLPTICSV